MHSKWKDTAAVLKRLADKYAAKKQLPLSQIHQDILLRAVRLLEDSAPDAAAFFEPQLELILPYTVIADEPGDRENGAGRHYYCGCSTGGTPLYPVNGYLKNGKGLFAKSARTMFEEDYTMALTMQRNGFICQSTEYLGRAVHMLSDMCCLPHAAKMTYFSSKRNIHISYEELARALYPEFVPVQHISYEQLRRFAMRSSFSTALNENAVRICGEMPMLFHEPVKEIKNRLYDTEAAVAALLYRFYRDTKVTPLRGHYIAEGMVCRPFHDMPAMKIHVTEEGLTFRLKGMQVNSRLGSVFTAAHRKNGRFSLSLVQEKNGLVLSKSNRLVPFDPRDKDQLYGIY